MAKCFTAEPLSDAVFSRINGVSYKQNAHIKRADLRYVRVLHVNFQGHTQVGELICNKRIAARLLSVFKQLYAARYPIERMVLIDQYGADDVQSMTANNTSCFNYRAVQGSSKLSKHSMGFAIDINPLYNPCVRRINGKQNVSPPKGRAYADRSKAFSYKITRNDLCYKLFTQQGFTWGGNWRSVKDYQHFEWR